MAKTFSTMHPLGTLAPSFELPNATAMGKKVSLQDYRESKGLLVAFLCNHCPFVQHINRGLVEVANDYRERGIAFVAINSNDTEKYPDDSPDKMAEMAKEQSYPFEYLFDETQDVARAYAAACTPDFFLFDEKRQLIWRGRMDGSSPGNPVPVTGEDMRQAFDDFLSQRPLTREQIPSMGCNIKWKVTRPS